LKGAHYPEQTKSSAWQSRRQAHAFGRRWSGSDSVRGRPVLADTGGALSNYFYDLSNQRICKFGSNGRFLNHWDGSGSAGGRLSNVGGIAVDQQGNVYVAELFVNRVLKFHQR
jgi:hypothetical protein